MLAVLVLLLGGPCAAEYESVVPAEFQIFLDPSEANRQAVTSKLVLEALPKLRDCELVTRLGDFPGSGGGSCLERALITLKRDVDHEILAAGLEDQAAFYRTCAERLGLRENSGPKRKIADLEPRLLELWTAINVKEFFRPDENELPRGKTAKSAKRREELLIRARKTCVDPSSGQTCPGLSLLLAAADPVVEKSLSSLPETPRRWFELQKMYPDRLKFLAAALDRPLSGQRNKMDDFFVIAAMKEIFLDERDPRLWDPKELAVLVLSTRKRPGGAKLTDPQNGGEAIRLLGPRIGYQRANRLIKSTLPQDFFKKKRSSELRSYRHFETEELAYEREWQALPLDPATAKLERWSQTRGGETHPQFMLRRWHETDERAPHPDIDHVLLLVEKWEREGGP